MSACADRIGALRRRVVFVDALPTTQTILGQTSGYSLIGWLRSEVVKLGRTPIRTAFHSLPCRSCPFGT